METERFISTLPFRGIREHFQNLSEGFGPNFSPDFLSSLKEEEEVPIQKLMTAKFSSARKLNQFTEPYKDFDQLDGTHPWMKLMPEGHVSYRVRELPQGRVSYFNYVLAKEMGLIPSHHSHAMNSNLENKIIKTFSLQIINEYDELNGKKIPNQLIKPHRYMATRYLQLQHSNKQGKTSGDGRGIWNGVLEHRGKFWDVSSRGTGVTCLAPGAVQAKKPLQTGGEEFGYGCGQAEIDELIGAAIMAESLHLQGLATERVLCIIDLGKGVGIGVRAAPNLLRPAHLFLYLKQNRWSELKRATDYFIQRQIDNGEWNFQHRSEKRYDELVHFVSESFGHFTAQLEMDYIFAWLDWDGDNVLANAGIIDYGSVRQFGLRHDEYRYDDIERFSTNLKEQRVKARLMVQVFAQLSDYLKTKKKKPLRQFAGHSAVKKFNEVFARYRQERLLYRMGFNQRQRNHLLTHHLELFNSFDRIFTSFETAKVSGSPQKVPDGVNHPALYNMRSLLRELPEFYLRSQRSLESVWMPVEDFHRSILSSFAKSRDLRLGEKARQRIIEFQNLYKKILKALVEIQSEKGLLKSLQERTQVLCSEQRITGNALIQIVEQIILEQKRGLPRVQIQRVIDRLVFDQLGVPEVPVSGHYKKIQLKPTVQRDLYDKILFLVEEYKEDI